MTSNQRASILRFVGLLIGAVLFYVTVQQSGGAEVLWSYLVKLGIHFSWVVVNSFGWMLVYTLAWYYLIHVSTHTVTYLRLLKVKLAGEGVNFMTPLGFFAGDPIRAMMLKKYVGRDVVVGSVVVDRILHSLAAYYFCLAGISILFCQNVNFPLWFSVFLLSTYIILCVGVTFFLALLIRQGKIHYIENHGWTQKLMRRFPKVGNFFRELEDYAAHNRNQSWHFMFKIFVLHFIGRLMGVVEIFAIVYFLKGTANIYFCFALTALTSFFSAVFGFIPGALGVLESMYAQFFALYGLAPEIGVSVQIVRRLRVLVWVAVGILLMDYKQVVAVLRGETSA